MFFRKFNSFVAALLVVALLIGSVSFALAADYPFAATLKTSGTLRKAASESSVVLAVLPAGDAVYVTGESGNYYIGFGRVLKKTRAAGVFARGAHIMKDVRKKGRFRGVAVLQIALFLI